MILIVNNGSVKRLLGALNDCNIPYHVYDATKDDLMVLKKEQEITGVILSGGRMKLSHSLKFEKIAQNFQVLNQLPGVPVLGICFGCQILHMLYGGRVRDLGKYTCKDMDVFSVDRGLLNGCETTSLRFCFSDLVVGESGKPFAWFDFRGKKEVCGFKFSRTRIGIMFHPEHHKESHQILRNFARGV